MNRFTRLLSLALLCLVLPPAILAQTSQPSLPAITPVQSVWNPMIDQQQALPEGDRNLNRNDVWLPMNNQTVKTGFGGFRVAPSTPAHSAGDTTRDLSSVGSDFNKDGCEDIVTFQVQTLTFMAGDCHGNFTKVGSQTTAQNIYHPVAVDINHDGYPDIIAMTFPFQYSGTVVALINLKNGTFSAPVVISKKASLYSGLMSMNVYDVNGDGNPDVVISGLGTQDSMTNSNVVFEVILGNADGTFNTANLIETDGVIPYKPTFGFDGGTALHVTNGQLYLYGVLMQSALVQGTRFNSELIYRWAVATNGQINVASPQITTLPFFSSAPNKYLKFADLNGDGIDDMTLMNGDGMLYTAIGAQDGSFGTLQAALPATATDNAATVSFRDMDGDGKIDAIISGSFFVGCWPGNGDGTFRSPKVTYFAGYGVNATSGLVFPVSNAVIDDFDGDGIPDIAYFDTVKRALSFYKGKPDDTFVGAPDLVSTSGDFQTNDLIVLATPDLNGDGYKDVIVNSAYGILSGINDGKGNFTFHLLSPLQPISGVSAFTADFNGDGKDDIVFLSTDSSNYPHLFVGLSNGDGTITAVAQKLPYSAPYAPVVSVGDINGDGIPDVLIGVNNYIAKSYGVYPMINDGKGNLTAGTFINAGVTLYGASLADLNGDGKADVVLSYGAYASTTTAVYLASSTGTYPASPSSIVQNTLPVGSTLVKDVTGDGIADIVADVTNGASEGIMLYVGKGDGTFNTGTPLVTGIVPYYVDAADLNGDGYPDIFFSTTEGVLTDAADAYMGVVVMTGTGNNGFAAPRHYNIYTASAPIFAVDLVHNGAPSLLASSGSTGTTVLLNNGASILTVSSSKTTMSTVDTTSITVQAAPYYSDQITPTGYIDLLVDGVIVNRLALAANATATFTLSSLTVGTHTVSATYEGDTNYNVNTHSNTMSIIVSKAIPSFVLSSSAPTLGLSIGGSASASLALQANNAFAGPVSLTCSGAPAGTTCSFSQNNVTLAPGQTVTSIVTIASVKSASLHQGKPIGAATGTGVALALCLMLPLVRRRKRVVTLLTTVVLVALLMNVAGCSGGTNANPQAPIGTYSVSVSATPSDTTVAAQSLTMLVTLSK